MTSTQRTISIVSHPIKPTGRMLRTPVSKASSFGGPSLVTAVSFSSTLTLMVLHHPPIRSCFSSTTTRVLLLTSGERARRK